MCGILLSLCPKGSGRFKVPEVFRDKLSLVDDKTIFESDDRAMIRSLLIEPDLNEDLFLSPSDELKLKSLPEIRSLSEILVKLRNNVKKKNSSELEEQIQQIEERLKSITNYKDSSPSLKIDTMDSLVSRIASRGPDYVNYTNFSINNHDINLFLSVLSLRQPFNKQPIEGHGFILQFNGELYNEGCFNSNDTAFIMDSLLHELETNDRHTAVLKTLVQLSGEFAFTILDTQLQKVYFGKDYVGKRSLLYSLEDDSLVVSSLTPTNDSRTNYIEVQSDLIYIYDLQSSSLSTLSYHSLWDKHPSVDTIKFQCRSDISSFEQSHIDQKVLNLYAVLNEACAVRQSTIHPLGISSGLSRLGILFSGGLDCTVVAALISSNITNSSLDHKSTIDLMTVGFDNPRTQMGAHESPDRKLSKKSWFHLSRKYNNEWFKIRLVEVNVDYESWLVHKKRVEKLMYPTNTEMDLSIAIAFYFASRAENLVKTELNDGCTVSWDEYIKNEQAFSNTETGYTSGAKVLFSGLGADELFAGYSRHESIFNDVTLETSDEDSSKHYEELSESLNHDIRVIYTRNLGRDDRVISSWGKELRYPFLANSVINHVINEIPPNLKLRIGWEFRTTKKDKVGKQVKTYVRKWILRELAGHIGLDWVKNELKRAIQFGAKSAKLEIGQNKAKGTDSLD